jgi:hypothetical protein
MAKKDVVRVTPSREMFSVILGSLRKNQSISSFVRIS